MSLTSVDVPVNNLCVQYRMRTPDLNEVNAALFHLSDSFQGTGLVSSQTEKASSAQQDRRKVAHS